MLLNKIYWFYKKIEKKNHQILSYYEGEKPFRSFKYRLKRELLKYIWIGQRLKIKRIAWERSASVPLSQQCPATWLSVVGVYSSVGKEASTKTTVQVAVCWAARPHAEAAAGRDDGRGVRMCGLLFKRSRQAPALGGSWFAAHFPDRCLFVRAP